MEILRDLLKENRTRILFLVADGIGGVPHPDYGYKTELEYAKTPNLDELAAKSVTGLTIPVDHGITPGSGPAHLSLFGYDPIRHNIGRGVLEALGIGFKLEKKDVAIRGNFCTLGPDGLVLDRRAGRIPTDESREIVEKLQEAIKEIDGVQIIWRPGKEHRFVLVLRGEGLSDRVAETDPQKEGKPPVELEPLEEDAKKTSEVLKKLISRAKEILKDEKKANFILLRGYAKPPELIPFPEKYGLKSLSLAYYPMYKGLTRLLGMDTPDVGDSFEDVIKAYREIGREYDYVYLHYKDTDKAGEDGDFLKKVDRIENLDRHLPEILGLKPDVVVVTGDHSTPSLLAGHSWHPNPTILYSPHAGADDVHVYTERACKRGYLGIIPATKLMPLALANALRLKKFGA